MHPPPGKATYLQGGKRSTIDYFALQVVLANAVDCIHVCTGEPVGPHKPVELIFKPLMAELRYLAFKVHQKLPVTVPLGPLQPGKPWDDVDELLQRVLLHFQGGANTHLDDGLLQSAYAAFVDRAEQELGQLTDTKVHRPGFRGLFPKLVWRSVMLAPRPISDKEAELSEAHSAASGWMWVIEHARAFLGLLMELQQGAVPDGPLCPSHHQWHEGL